ncbi:DEAD/DEAH box helicase [Geodermatophilus sp. SYSU D00779]
MTSLLPSLQAADLRRALIDYLGTTFALADDEVRIALEDFLTDPQEGIFRGPYVRLRLPFRPADEDWAAPLEWFPEGFAPYRHQAVAFSRLSSKQGDPRPTIVTTGTGSGKTESFLVPILDHVLRARRAGQRGIKALVLYPMNALANDQAGRLAQLITGDPRLSDVTAGLYTGDKNAPTTRVTQDGLITDRAVMQSDPPDILLTNYKMLDQLLLRPSDAPLWQLSRESLRYLVLDEFHTYDGAQGTDVAMLLRRLGLVLGVDEPGRPLGDVVPVATSATLGSGDPSALLTFAATVFGREIEPDVIVAEDRVTSEEWLAEREASDARPGVTRPRGYLDLPRVAGELRQATTPDEIIRALIRELFVEQPKRGEHLNDLNDEDAQHLVHGLSGHGELGWLLTHHDLTKQLLRVATTPSDVADLARRLFPTDRSPANQDGVLLLDALLGLLSLARVGMTEAGAGPRFLSTDVQLWVREVSRVERLADNTPRFRWTDDGVDTGGQLYLPAIYCRFCGRSGWRVLIAPTGHSVETDAASIRAEALRENRRVRSLMFAPGEAADLDSGKAATGLMWFDTKNRELLTGPPDLDVASLEENPIVPVLVNGDDDRADRRTPDQRDVCPACERENGIRFLGSGIATLASVSLSSVFASEHLERAEKKTLLFTDSVQDAAHRAGFVQARSHTLTFRGALRTALTEQRATLPELADAVLTAAGDDPHRRHVLVPPVLVGNRDFRAFLDPDASDAQVERARRRVAKRLAFDIALEFGLNSRLGRTLELTGSAVAEVLAGGTDDVHGLGAAALDAAVQRHALSPDLDGSWVAGRGTSLMWWVRGVLDRIRSQGGIHHPWLGAYLAADGNRWRIWGGRDRAGGMPAFPSGRAAPAFPTTAKGSELLASISGARSWYARWASACLDISPNDGAVITRHLLDVLVDAGTLTAVTSNGGARIWALPPQNVAVTVPSEEALQSGEHLLRCPVCHTAVPGTTQVVDELDGAPCVRAGCTGRLGRERRGDDYYRTLYASPQARRVVAAEHTSLLPDDTRLEREQAFRRDELPGDPNVLVATPTLELGIDIGDLSTVMLSSLPKSVAGYQQRIGRAGRRTGNALVLAYVPARGTNLPRWAEPLSVIDGDVRPPATYLDAVEILHRQYVAHLVDRQAADPAAPSARLATPAVLETWGGDSWTGRLLTDARAHAAEYVVEFLSQFGDRVRPDTAEDLRRWAGAGIDSNQVSGLEALWYRAVDGWRKERTELGERITRAQDALVELTERANQPAATDEDKQLWRSTKAELSALRKRRQELVSQHWVQALEERGVLPNYTLLDDTVTLDVAVRWFDQETEDYHDEPRSYQRGSRIALTEFAPGSTFYAQGIAARIDAVDLASTGTDHVQDWVLCARCGWGASGTVSVTACPRCGDAAIQDTGQRLQVLPLERVSAQVSRDEAAITDALDDREREQFATVTAADIDPADITEAWHLADFPFGAEYIRATEIRWLNLGRTRESGRDRSIAGFDVKTPLFRVCPGCGVTPAAQRRDEQDARHRGWCPHRRDLDIEWREIALGRTLRTQAVRMLVPPQYTTDHFAAVSFRAALLLGLREVIGGDPDHLDVVDVHAPVGGVDRVALLLHDTVPGGTGYLADFARPDRVRELLQAALDVVENCPCAAEGKLACHRCLLPFVHPGQVDKTSRARAAQLLAEILGLVAPLGEAAQHAWQPVQAKSIADVPPPSPESHLEQRFRDALCGALAAQGASVRQKPQPDGTLVEFALSGSHRRWTMRPQVPLGNVKPDFVLSTQDPTVPEVCIFTDGALFHASAEHNRVRDDAEKRAALRDQGKVVWAITSKDLDRFEALTAGTPASPLGALTDPSLAMLRSKLLPGSAPETLLKDDAVSQLLAWIRTPDADAWSKLADRAALAFGALPSARRFRLFAKQLVTAAGDVLCGEPTVGDLMGPLAGWSWCQGGSLALTAALASAPLGLHTALVVDDRDDRLEKPAGQDAWREWLRLSNVFGFADQPMTIAALSQVIGGAVTPTMDAPTMQFESHVDPAWQGLIDGALTDAERALLRRLAAVGVPVPEQGFETDDGTPLDLAWPDAKVCVRLDESDEPVDGSWTVAPTDVDAITELLGAPGAGQE